MPPLRGAPSLPCASAGERRLVHQFAVEGAVVEQRVGVRDQERRQRGETSERHPAQRAPTRPRPVREQAREHGGGERQDHDPAGVLARASQPQADAREQVVARASFAQDAGAAEQRERDRCERRHVVEREVRVEDRQERHRLDRRRQQADRAVEQPRARQVKQPQRQRPQHRSGDTREREHALGVVLVGMDGAARAAVGDGQQSVQHVGERRRVGEVAGVERSVLEHFDCVREEVVGLVAVVRVGQPLA